MIYARASEASERLINMYIFLKLHTTNAISTFILFYQQ